MIRPHAISVDGAAASPVTARMMRDQLGIEAGEETESRLTDLGAAAVAWVEEQSGLAIALGTRALRYPGPLRPWGSLLVPGYVASVDSAALADGTALAFAGVERVIRANGRNAVVSGSLADGSWPDEWTPDENAEQDVILTATLGLTAARFTGGARAAVLLRASIDYYQTYDAPVLRALSRLVEGIACRS